MNDGFSLVDGSVVVTVVRTVGAVVDCIRVVISSVSVSDFSVSEVNVSSKASVTTVSVISKSVSTFFEHDTESRITAVKRIGKTFFNVSPSIHKVL